MTKDKPTQIWKFTASQTLLIKEQARMHAAERAPLQAYQARAQNDLLVQFQEELGIPKGVLLTVDLDTLQFTERQPVADNVIPFPTPPKPDNPAGDDGVRTE